MKMSIEGLLERIGLVSKPSIGIALSGGGARGFGHLGVLMAFENFDIKPGILAGVSAGAIVSTLYGAGLSPRDIMNCFAETHSFSDYTDWALPKKGLFRLEKFAKLLDSWLPVKYLEELSIPTVICATDLDKSKSVGWSKGEIVPRVLASCSIPVVFQPTLINGSHYIDGGVLRNLPAWAIRDFCKELYGINCSPLKDYEYKGTIIDIAYRTYQLMAKANTLQDISLCDHVITLNQMSSIGTFALKDMEKAVMNGYDQTSKYLETHLS